MALAGRPPCLRRVDPCRDVADPHAVVVGTTILHDARRGGVLGSGRLDLLEGVLDQRVVVFFREITLNQLRGDPE